MWDCLTKIATIITIIGLPAAVFGIKQIIDMSLIKYDSYREVNDGGGYTISIGNYTRKERKEGKRQNPSRQYHIKGKNQADDTYWR